MKEHYEKNRYGAPGAAFKGMHDVPPALGKISAIPYGQYTGDLHTGAQGYTGAQVRTGLPGSNCNAETFRKEWKRMSKDSSARFRLLRRLAPHDFPRMFRDEIPSSLLGEILETLWDWQLTQVSCSSPEAGTASEQTQNGVDAGSGSGSHSSSNPPRADKASKASRRKVNRRAPSLENGDMAGPGLVHVRKSLETGVQRQGHEQPTCLDSPSAIPSAKARAGARKKPGAGAVAGATVHTKLEPEHHATVTWDVGTGSLDTFVPRSAEEHAAVQLEARMLATEMAASQARRDENRPPLAEPQVWAIEREGPRKQKFPKYSLIIQPCENLKRFDDILSSFGILKPVPADEFPVRDQRQREPNSSVGTAKQALPVNTKPPVISSPTRNASIAEAVSDDVAAQIRNLKFSGREFLSGPGSEHGTSVRLSAPSDVSAHRRNVRLGGREFASGTSSEGDVTCSTDADELQHQEQRSSLNSSFPDVIPSCDDEPSSNAGAEESFEPTPNPEILWLFDMLEAITRCGRFPMALRLMGEKARFIVATLLDHFASGLLMSEQQEESASILRTRVDDKENIADFQDVEREYMTNFGMVEVDSECTQDEDNSELTNEGGKSKIGSVKPLPILSNYIAGNGPGTRFGFSIEQLKELRNLYRVDKQ